MIEHEFLEMIKKKLLQINPVIRTNTSTGRIMQEIGEIAMANGWESYIAYSGGRDGMHPACKSTPVPVGNKLDVAWHAVETRLLDRHGLASRCATKAFIKEIERIQPDIIHIHNIHGYFLNYKILFDFLKRYGKPVVWTVHDCWLYTGHCYYYSSIGCNRWKSGCGSCPQQKRFPTSWFVDRSKQNFIDKQKAFNSLDKHRFVVAPVSKWMADEMRQSLFQNCTIQVMHNGIDLDTFKPQGNEKEVRDRYGIGNRHIIMAIATLWHPEKGVEDLMKMSRLLHEDEVIVMVGVDDELMKRLPQNIIGIKRTANVQQLAELYSAATAVVNPTWQDNYPTVNLEAIACGTPVVTYRTGGSPESITSETGFVVEQGDVHGMLEAVRKTEQQDKNCYSQKCRDHAERWFRKEDRYMDYIKLYDDLLKNTR